MFSLPWLPKTFVLGALLYCSSWRPACGGDDRNQPSPAQVTETSADPRAQLAKEIAEGNEATAAAIRKGLLSRTSVDADGVPVSQLIDTLMKKHGLQWKIDKETLVDEGIRLDQPVELHVADITLKSALRLLLAPLKLTTVIEDEVLTITTAQRASELLETRVYNVGAIVGDDGFEDYTQLVEAITSCISMEAWNNVGGPGSVREFHAVQSLVVRQTQEIHEKIAVLLRELNRFVKNSKKNTVPPAEPDPIRDRELAIRQLLQTRTDFSAVDQPLEKLLKELADKHHLPLWIDRTALKDEGVELEKPVSIALRNVWVESALNHLLRPFQLTWVIEDEVLKVTSAQVEFDILVTRAYDVGDFVIRRAREGSWPPKQGRRRVPIREEPNASQGAGGGGGSLGMGGGLFAMPPSDSNQAAGDRPPAMPSPPSPESLLADERIDFTELIELVMTTVAPELSFASPELITIRELSPNLVVLRQTPAFHESFEVLLHRLRSTARTQKSAPPRTEPEDPDALKLFVYHFTDQYSYPTEPLAKLIPEVVARETWQSAGGKGTLIVQPTSLVIRQTPAVHREIVKLLYDVVLQAK